jgi:hypothetical protein
MITEQEFKNHITNETLTLEICKEWIIGGGILIYKIKMIGHF